MPFSTWPSFEQAAFVPPGAACARLRAGIQPLRDNIPDMELTLLKAFRDQTLSPLQLFSYRGHDEVVWL